MVGDEGGRLGRGACGSPLLWSSHLCRPGPPRSERGVAPAFSANARVWSRGQGAEEAQWVTSLLLGDLNEPGECSDFS